MQPRPQSRSRRATPTVHFHLFGQVPLEDMHNLQRRLAYEAASRDDGRITILACEHEPLITIGRAGSRADIRIDFEELARQQIEVQYVARGGGTLLHGPGQLALYVIAPLSRLRWTIGDFLRRLQAGLATTFDELLVRHQRRPGQFGLWGRSGLLATFGLSVRHGISLHGVAINVNPELRLYRRVLAHAGDPQSCLGSLLTERPSAGRMAGVRSTLIASLAPALGCETSQVFTGHSLLPDSTLERELPRAA
jgi:lipoyl(octanoyl) transferase